MATALNNLAALLDDDPATLAEAEAHYDEAAAIYARLHGADSRHVAVALGNLARVRHARGDLPGALDAQRRSVAIKETVHGADHPHVAQALMILGRIAKELGHLEDARAHLQRALDIRTAAFSADHAKAAAARRALGEVMFALHARREGDADAVLNASLYYDEVLPLLQRVVEDERRLHGDAHRATALALHNVATLLWNQDCASEEARTHGAEALAIATRALGPDDPTTKRYAEAWGEKKEEAAAS